MTPDAARIVVVRARSSVLLLVLDRHSVVPMRDSPVGALVTLADPRHKIEKKRAGGRNHCTSAARFSQVLYCSPLSGGCSGPGMIATKYKYRCNLSRREICSLAEQRQALITLHGDHKAGLKGVLGVGRVSLVSLAWHAPHGGVTAQRITPHRSSWIRS